MAKLRVRQVKSGLGAPRKIRRTLEALGLRHQRAVVKPDNPAVRGMLFKIKHLVEVEPVTGDSEKGV
ncbi:MAG: 50S ribosomal protein L30 [Gemmatimonadota bacterium]|nr:MAG: 50S ribosomal protein L30 [Gemmatimonadota bacterium]